MKAKPGPLFSARAHLWAAIAEHRRLFAPETYSAEYPHFKDVARVNREIGIAVRKLDKTMRCECRNNRERLTRAQVLIRYMKMLRGELL